MTPVPMTVRTGSVRIVVTFRRGVLMDEGLLAAHEVVDVNVRAGSVQTSRPPNRSGVVLSGRPSQVRRERPAHPRHRPNRKPARAARSLVNREGRNGLSGPRTMARYIAQPACHAIF